MTRVIIGGIAIQGKLLQLIDEGIVPSEEHAGTIQLELPGDSVSLSLQELRKFKEALNYAERLLVKRKEQAVLARNLPLLL